MKALRKIVKAKDHTITVKIPDDFSEGESFEVIVLPTNAEQDSATPSFEEKNNKVSRKEAFGKYKGKIWISPDFNEPLEDFKEYTE